jgi:hypothetical protein
MMKVGPHDEYIQNEVYDPNKYWLGPTWMASTKPVADGFCAYGYEMIYLYLVQRSVGTLQDGRAVEHWNPETGEVNTSNVNFPWAASCMAGSIWAELSEEDRNIYVQCFHGNRYPDIQAVTTDRNDSQVTRWDRDSVFWESGKTRFSDWTRLHFSITSTN